MPSPQSNANAIGAALQKLPADTYVEDIDLWKNTITVKYSNVSKQAVERAGWTHVKGTDYYGVAEIDYMQEASGGFSFGGMM